MKLVFAFLALSSTCFFASAHSCIDPVGVDNNTAAAIKGALDANLPYLWIPQALGLFGEIVKHETPIQFRLAQIQATTVYHVAAKYHATALDIWGNDEYRICDNADSFIHREIALAYAFYYSGITIIPSVEEIIKPFLENFGLPVSRLLEDVPANPPTAITPWGLAKIVVEEMSRFALNDGWNADGSLTNDYNKMPYSDFDFVDANGDIYNAYKVDEGPAKGNYWAWQPLLESNGLGYFTKQEHVTPMCGFTGRLYGMDKSYYNSFKAPKPNYDYYSAAEYVLEQTKNMATNDEQKMLIEFFDSKFTSIVPLQINWSIATGLDNFDFWFYDMTLVNTLYDATLLVWKEKVFHNAVRPTTVVHSIFDEEEVMTYVGPEGVGNVKGKDWQPYIRTMPHAEYPSGSSCICTAFAETLQLLTGTDDISVPLEQTFIAGSSKKEPGTTPASNITLTYNTWSDIATACGQSRLYGGMHFEESVPAGNELCSGFVDPVVEKAKLLRDGDSNGAFADKGDTNILVSERRRSKRRSKGRSKGPNNGE